MVVASDLHTERHHGILAGIDREFLARRICLAPPANGFDRGRRVLCSFIRNYNSRDRRAPFATPIKPGRSTIDSSGRASEFFFYCSSTPLIGSAAGRNSNGYDGHCSASPSWSRLFRNWRSTRRPFPAGTISFTAKRPSCVAAVYLRLCFRVGRFLRLVLATLRSSFRLIDLYMPLDAPRRDDFDRLPRLAASAAPAAICCFFDFAGITKRFRRPQAKRI